MTSVDVANLHAHLDAHPDDWPTRLVLADMLLDIGDERGAACQRWMVKRNRRRPTMDAPASGQSSRWYWYHARHPYARTVCPHARLPPSLFWKLPDHQSCWYVGHPTRQSAEAALLTALVAAGTI